MSNETHERGKKENTYRSTIPPALVAHIRHKSLHKYAHKTWISPTLPSPSLLYLTLPHPLPLAHLLAPNSLKIGVCGVHLEASLGWKSSGHSPKPSAARRLSAPKSRKMGQYSAAFEWGKTLGGGRGRGCWMLLLLPGMLLHSLAAVWSLFFLPLFWVCRCLCFFSCLFLCSFNFSFSFFLDLSLPLLLFSLSYLSLLSNTPGRAEEI